MKKSSIIIKIILGIIAAIAILGCVLFAGILFVVIKEDAIILDVYPSPKGDCQVEAVNYSIGGDEYCNYIYIDYPKGRKGFPAPGQHVSKKAIQIEETSVDFCIDYNVIWTSDDSFDVEVLEPDETRVIIVKLSGNGYTIVEGG
ncbi:hypothetical protein [Butyrivibrio sp. AC2005]|uniref:hypothetical protein n=1 Tax=Butyrivibrio sp. AC2005 TaxID=1280672 RepID=UPI0003FEB32A|nr:hypothetical protein [Butyrivibrio sp. AC2005]